MCARYPCRVLRIAVHLPKAPREVRGLVFEIRLLQSEKGILNATRDTHMQQVAYRGTSLIRKRPPA